MKTMNEEEKNILKNQILEIVKGAVSCEYAGDILMHEDYEHNSSIIDQIVDDVIESSCWQFDDTYNDDDIRFAIGRVFMSYMNIEC